MRLFFCLLFLGFSSSLIFGQAIEVTPAGNVGIGTSNPTYKLVVIGNTNPVDTVQRIHGGDSMTAVYRSTLSLIHNTDTTISAGSGLGITFEPLSNTGGGYFGLARISGIRENNTANNQDTALIFQTRSGASNATNDSEKMRINSLGNVGIGTTNPTSKLLVNLDDTGTKYVAICHSAAIGAHIYGANTTSQLRLTYPSVTDWDFLVNSAGALSLSSNSSERMKITTTGDITTTGGNFGVGSSGVPTYKITAETGYIGAKSGGLLGYGTGGNQLIVGYDSANRLLMDVNSAGVQTWTMSGASPGIIINGGSVGIGSTFGTYHSKALGIYGVTHSSLKLMNSTTGTANTSGFEIASLGEDGYIQNRSATGNLFVYLNGIERVSVKNNGNVGLGTSNPIYRLEVVGSAGISSPVYSAAGSSAGSGAIRHVSFSGTVGSAVAGDSLISNDLGNMFISPNTTGKKLFLSGGGWGSNGLTIDGNNLVGIGTLSPTEKLEVNGAVKATSFKVGSTTLNVPDYVFEDNYQLKSLEEVQAFIEKNGHLPGISSAKEINANGLDLPEMQLKLLEKVEELTLYSIKQNQEIQKLKKEKDELLETLLKRIENLEKNK